jgi:hypothetical protein
MKYELSEHAATRVRERKIETAWLEEVITNPQRKEVDPDDPALGTPAGSYSGTRLFVCSTWCATRGKAR